MLDYFLHNPNAILLLPFVGLLLCLALAPLFFKDVWDKHFDKITLFWILLVFVPLVFILGWDEALVAVLHMAFYEYLPFVILLVTLFVISGGITIQGYFDGTPAKNLQLLLLGTVLASVMGTMGAAMLLIRPLLRIARERKHQSHLVLFFIILVGNIGGALTPLGDPPLFLGFLQGVDFFWTLQNLWTPWLVAVSILSVVFYALDSYWWRVEKGVALKPQKLQIKGIHNFLFLGLVIANLLLTAVWQNNEVVEFFGVEVAMKSLIRDGIFLLLAFFSYRTTSKTNYQENNFNFAPPREMAILFFGIFMTLIPVMDFLSGEGGQMVRHDLLAASELPSPVLYFWLTGIFSTMLDNAPTYLVFFKLANGQASDLMANQPTLLMAISLGAVFMGANSYIGNAPNFMIKTIADQQKIKTLHFFAYIFYSLIVLLPIYFLIQYLFLQ